jgi:uncharacterized damage-inducible protein DinB
MDSISADTKSERKPYPLLELSRYFHSEWTFARGLTRDLLAGLDPDELRWEPGRSIGPLWKHFRHVGRVQENYVRALDTGVVAFAMPEKGYRGGADAQALLTYLGEADVELEQRIGSLNWDGTVTWPDGETVSVGEHLLRLISHETIHHGVWITCCRLLGKPLPATWAAWDSEAETGKPHLTGKGNPRPA